jgi:hypothetical protein
MFSEMLSIKHSGSYSMRLENKTVPIIGIFVNGNATTGVVNAPSTNKADGYLGTTNFSNASDVRRISFYRTTRQYCWLVSIYFWWYW